MRFCSKWLACLALIGLMAGFGSGSAQSGDFTDADDYSPSGEYSPNYTHITVVGEDGRIKRALAPEACLAEAGTDPLDEEGQRLPMGCANNYNLQRMVADKRDLMRGRKISPAPAAPAARAARRYIEGAPAPLRGEEWYQVPSPNSNIPTASGSAQ